MAKEKQEKIASLVSKAEQDKIYAFTKDRKMAKIFADSTVSEEEKLKQVVNMLDNKEQLTRALNTWLGIWEKKWEDFDEFLRCGENRSEYVRIEAAMQDFYHGLGLVHSESFGMNQNRLKEVVCESFQNAFIPDAMFGEIESLRSYNNLEDLIKAHGFDDVEDSLFNYFNTIFNEQIALYCLCMLDDIENSNSKMDVQIRADMLKDFAIKIGPKNIALYDEIFEKKQMSRTVSAKRRLISQGTPLDVHKPSGKVIGDRFSEIQYFCSSNLEDTRTACDFVSQYMNLGAIDSNKNKQDYRGCVDKIEKLDALTDKLETLLYMGTLISTAHRACADGSKNVGDVYTKVEKCINSGQVCPTAKIKQEFAAVSQVSPERMRDLEEMVAARRESLSIYNYDAATSAEEYDTEEANTVSFVPAAKTQNSDANAISSDKDADETVEQVEDAENASHVLESALTGAETLKNDARDETQAIVDAIKDKVSLKTPHLTAATADAAKGEPAGEEAAGNLHATGDAAGIERSVGAVQTHTAKDSGEMSETSAGDKTEKAGEDNQGAELNSESTEAENLEQSDAKQA